MSTTNPETEEAEATTSADTPTPSTDSPPPDADAQTEDTSEPPEGGNSEAAKYRRRLRDTETERDTLRGQVEALQRAEVERLAGHLTQPSAIWAAGVELSDVLDDSGAVNADKVATAVTEAAETLGLARAPRTPRPDPTQGGQGGTGPTGPTFADAFGPGR